MRPVEITQTARHNSIGTTTTITNPPDDREIFKTLHDCMKDVGKFRQYIYYLSTSCDTTKLRNKIQKLIERIYHSFNYQRELIRKGSSTTGLIKSELIVRRFEKCLCFTLASLNYYEDLLHKFSMLLFYFPLTTDDHTNVVNLGFEDSTIVADEISYENHEIEENETNRYIELLNQIQCIQTLREEIEQIDVYQLRHHATSYSKDFVENMHKYTTDLITENPIRRHNRRDHYILHFCLNDDSSSSFSICNRRKFVCILTVILSILLMVGIIFTIIITTKI